jgi:putative phosphoribosyl transferase
VRSALQCDVGKFRDRAEAGRVLAVELVKHCCRPDVLVLGIPTGGVPVAAEVARALRLPLEVVTVHKLGGGDAVTLGAIARQAEAWNPDTLATLGLTPDGLTSIQESVQPELERREALYRDGRPLLEVAGRSVIVVDDGVSTGSSMRAAVRSLRRLGAAQVVAAAPVIAAAVKHRLEQEADAVVCIFQPALAPPMSHVYEDFAPVSAKEVRRLLEKNAEQNRPAA